MSVLLRLAVALMCVAAYGVYATEVAVTSEATVDAWEQLSVDAHVDALGAALGADSTEDQEQMSVLRDAVASSATSPAGSGDQVDVLAILDSVHANIAGEQARAAKRHAARRKHLKRKIHASKRVVRNLKRAAFVDQRKLVSAKSRRKTTEKRLKRVRSELSVAVQRMTTAQVDLEKTKRRKIQRVRSLNNQILDAQTRLKALRVIAVALAEQYPPNKPQRVLASLHERVSAGDMNTVFLQLNDEQESEVDVDELQAEASAIVANDDEADAADAENELEELDAETEAMEDEAVDESPVQALEQAPEVAAQARMMQVLQQLSSALPGDDDPHSLLALLNELLQSGRASLKELVANRKLALGAYKLQVTELRKVVIRARLRVERLRRRVHRLERRSARLTRHIVTLRANLEDNSKQTTLYERRVRRLQKHLRELDAQYDAATARRTMHLRALRKLKRRLAALAAKRGAALTISADAVAGSYRWEAGAWKECSKKCTDIQSRPLTGEATPAHTQPATDKKKLRHRVTTRKVTCRDFAHKKVDPSLCAGLKVPRRTKRCRLIPCAKQCTVSAWTWPKRCSNECGPGVRMGHRKILQPARFGGTCPQRNGRKGGLTQSKPCFVVKGCRSKAAKRRAFAELRALRKRQAANGTLPKKDPRHATSPDDDTSHVWSDWMKKFDPKAKPSKPLTPKQKKAAERRRRRRAAAARRRRQQQKQQQNQAQGAKVVTVQGPVKKNRETARERRRRQRRAEIERKRRERAAKRRAERARKRRERRRRAAAAAKAKAAAAANANAAAGKTQPTPQQKAAAAQRRKEAARRRRRHAREAERRRREARRLRSEERRRRERAIRAQRKAARKAKLQKCLGKCRGGKKGKKCRHNCREAARRRLAEYRRRRAAERQATGVVTPVTSAAAPGAPAAVAAAPGAPAAAAAAPGAPAAAATAAPAAAATAAPGAPAAAVTATKGKAVGQKKKQHKKKLTKKQRKALRRVQEQQRRERRRLQRQLKRAQQKDASAAGAASTTTAATRAAKKKRALKRLRKCLGKCRSGKKGKKCRGKCRGRYVAWKARQPQRKHSAAAVAAAKSIPPPPTPAQPSPSKRVPRAFHYKPSTVVVNEDGAVTSWNDATKHGRDLMSVGGRDVEVAPRRAPGKRAVRFDHTGLQSRRLRMGERFDVFVVLRFDGNPHKPDNRWGAASAFMINAPKKTPASPFLHGTSGGIGVAVTDGQFRLIAEGKQWGDGGADVQTGAKYILRLRRRGNTYKLFVGDAMPQASVATLTSDIIEDDTARLKLGVSDALYYGWEGAIYEVVGFNDLLNKQQLREVYERLHKKYL